jgi:hypothetical protein
MPRISDNVIQTDRTLAVDVGDGAWMDMPIPDWLWHLRYADEPERGTQCSDRLLAAGLLESYLYLVEECTKEEAWRRIKIMRKAIQIHRSLAAANGTHANQ